VVDYLWPSELACWKHNGVTSYSYLERHCWEWQGRVEPSIWHTWRMPRQEGQDLCNLTLESVTKVWTIPPNKYFLYWNDRVGIHTKLSMCVGINITLLPCLGIGSAYLPTRIQGILVNSTLESVTKVFTIPRSKYFLTQNLKYHHSTEFIFHPNKIQGGILPPQRYSAIRAVFLLHSTACQRLWLTGWEVTACCFQQCSNVMASP